MDAPEQPDLSSGPLSTLPSPEPVTASPAPAATPNANVQIGPPSHVLLFATEPAQFTTLVAMWRSRSTVVHQLSPDRQLNFGLLSEYGTVVITTICSRFSDRGRVLQESEIHLLQEWVRNGGNLLVAADACFKVGEKNAVIIPRGRHQD